MPKLRACVAALVAVTAFAHAIPASAQFSDSYNFLKAVRDKDVNKARTLLDAPGSNLANTKDPATGEAPLHIVVKRRDLGWLGLLLQANADPNIRDKDGNTPLLLCAVSGWTECVRIMLLVQARVDQKNSAGETPLIKAVQARDVDSVKMLLDGGANPDLTDNAAGYSARQYALQDTRGGPVARMLKDAKAKSVAPVQGPKL